MSEPLKRDISLQPLSRDHHQGLLLCWKIKRGIQNNTRPEIIFDYIRWFFIEHLEPHFFAEEQQVFPLLEHNHPLIIKALQQHTAMRAFVSLTGISTQQLLEFASLLEEHIRLEEREIFAEIQLKTEPSKLNQLHLQENEKVFCENDKFSFWSS